MEMAVKKGGIAERDGRSAMTDGCSVALGRDEETDRVPGIDAGLVCAPVVFAVGRILHALVAVGDDLVGAFDDIALRRLLDAIVAWPADLLAIHVRAACPWIFPAGRRLVSAGGRCEEGHGRRGERRTSNQ